MKKLHVHIARLLVILTCSLSAMQVEDLAAKYDMSRITGILLIAVVGAIPFGFLLYFISLAEEGISSNKDMTRS